MSEELITLAVGGIAAGRVLTGYGTAARHVETPSISFPVIRDMTLPSDTLRVSYYSRMALFYKTRQGREERLEFWVDTETIRDEIDLLRELANCYRPVVLKGEP